MAVAGDGHPPFFENTPQQLRRLEKDFLESGGLRERMTRARLAYRSQSP